MQTITPHGTYTHGVVLRGDAAGFMRADRWTPADGSRACDDTMQAASARDDSPVYTGVYNPQCACCWLGHGHTSDKHASLLA